MIDRKHRENTERRVCSDCGGAGQFSFFRGVSRFVMDWEDCPECHGTGFVETEPPSAALAGKEQSTGAVAKPMPPAPSDDHD